MSYSNPQRFSSGYESRDCSLSLQLRWLWICLSSAGGMCVHSELKHVEVFNNVLHSDNLNENERESGCCYGAMLWNNYTLLAPRSRKIKIIIVLFLKIYGGALCMFDACFHSLQYYAHDEGGSNLVEFNIDWYMFINLSTEKALPRHTQLKNDQVQSYLVEAWTRKTYINMPSHRGDERESNLSLLPVYDRDSRQSDGNP